MLDKQILIAPIGGKEQSVVPALEMLLQQGIPIDKVVILHLSGKEQAEAAEQARMELSSMQKICFQVKPFSRGTESIQSPGTDEEINTLLYCLYNEIRQAKKNGTLVHLLCSCGHEMIAAYAMLTAQLLFGKEDCLWYLVSEGEPAEPRKGKLLQVPFLSWSAVFPAVPDLYALDDPTEAFRQIIALRMEDKYRDAEIFIGKVCTPGERDVLKYAVTQSLSNAQIAEKLDISERTVESHMRSILKKGSSFWKDSHFNRVGLTIAVLPYFQMKIIRE